MAKSDQGDIRNDINNYMKGNALNSTQSLQNVLGGQNQQFQNHYDQAFNQNWQDYQDLSNRVNQNYGAAQNNYGAAQQNYQNIQNAPTRDFGAYDGYQNFANTGGYSPEDIQNIRARGIAPIRGVYSNALANLNRQKALTGGYMPNYAGALGRMAREQAITGSDQATNVEAQLADQIRQGKLAGLSGMTGIDAAISQLANQRLGLGNQAMGELNQALGMQNQAVGLGTSLYGTAPGLSEMTGNQLNTSSGLNVQAQQLYNNLVNEIIQRELDNTKTPGAFSQAMGNIGSIGNLASGGASLFDKIKNLFGGPSGSYPSTGTGQGGGDNSTEGQFPTYPDQSNVVPYFDLGNENLLDRNNDPNFRTPGDTSPIPSTSTGAVITLPDGTQVDQNGNPIGGGPDDAGNPGGDPNLDSQRQQSIFSPRSRGLFANPNDPNYYLNFMNNYNNQSISGY